MKNYKPNLIYVFLMIALVLGGSCSKIFNASPDTPPMLNATSPADNDQLASGQTLNIKGEVSDVSGLTSLEIKVTVNDTGKEIFKSTTNLTDMTTYAFDIPWKIVVDDWLTTTMTITVTNNKNLKTEKKINLKIWL